MTFVDNLGVLIFLPLILSSIPIKINPVTLFVETEINWLLGLAYLFLSVLYTIYVFIPNKLKMSPKQILTELKKLLANNIILGFHTFHTNEPGINYTVLET